MLLIQITENLNSFWDLKCRYLLGRSESIRHITKDQIQNTRIFKCLSQLYFLDIKKHILRSTLPYLQRKHLCGASVGFYESPFEEQLETRLKF